MWIQAFLLLFGTVTVEKVPGFALEGGVPNATWLASEGRLSLIYSKDGLKEVVSTNGEDFTATNLNFAGLQQQMSASNLVPADLIVREVGQGQRRYFFKGLSKPGGGPSRHMYAAEQSNGGTWTLLNNGQPVYLGDTAEPSTVEVIDIIEKDDGNWRLFYVSLYDDDDENTHTATSDDEGLSWTFESDNPFGDKGQTNPAQTNVDPGPFRLADGRHVAVTMAGKILYFWTSSDGGVSFTRCDTTLTYDVFAAEAPSANGLFDPSFAQLPDGTLMLYTTAGTDTPDGTIVAAKVNFEPETPTHFSRWLPHLTNAAGTFQSTLTFTNTGSTTETLTLYPFTVSGASLPEVEVTVGPGAFQQAEAATLLGATASHFAIEGNASVVVTAGYKAASPLLGSTAHLNEKAPGSTTRRVLPGETALVFDGAAVVNTGTSPIRLEAFLIAADGTASNHVVVTQSLEAHAKALLVFSQLFGDATGYQVALQANGETAMIFLRGSQAGAEITHLYEVDPL